MTANKQIHTATNQKATTEETLENVFSMVRDAAAATQRCGKHVFTATVERHEKSCVFYDDRAKQLQAGRTLELSHL